MSSLAQSKQDLINEIIRRITDNIIEPANANLLIKLINKADTLTEAISIATLGTTYKRTGFHFDKRLEKTGDTIKYFKKNATLSFKTSDAAITHKLIIGDNYDALLNLLIEYKSKIDVIYIDPPYGKDSMGEFATTNYDNAITRDNLLSMMYPRLVLARQLLCNSGVIYCSIDDRNQAYLKCLFDEVFGERNFVENFIFLKNSGGSLTHFTLTRHEHVLFYCKDKTQCLADNPEIFKMQKNGFDDVHERIAQYKRDGLTTGQAKIELKKFYKTRDDLKGIKLYNNIDACWQVYRLLPITAPNNNYYEVLHPITRKPVTTPARGWSWSKETMEKNIQSGRVVFGADEKSVPNQKLYLQEAQYEHKRSTFQTDQAEGNKTLHSILENVNIFDNPKPQSLLNYLLTGSKTNAVILDFFAGSGTTGQVVLELNKSDGGNRQFILATNNEKTPTTPNGIAHDVTAKRLKRVMTGACYNGTDNFKWLEKNHPLGGNLDVYDITTVASFGKNEGKTLFDVIDETLYSQPPLSVADKIKWVCGNFEHTQKYLESESHVASGD
ncbi:MAG: site-specific DNA-methyltransferase [Defluviitaleaceae bacterium]|nr:site-specific DNA-methyltransferase [Defluviitaleaceae bacterium]